MPRTVLGSADRAAKAVIAKQERFERDLAEKNAALTKILRKNQYGEALTMEKAAEKIGMNFRTYAKYLKNPDLLPLGVLRKMQMIFNISEEDLLPLLLMNNKAP